MSGAVLNLMGASSSGGASSTTITVAYQYIAAFGSSGTISAAYRLNQNGSVYQQINGGAYTLVTNGPNWCDPASQASNYECYATLTNGGLGVGSAAVDTWLPLSTTRDWLVTRGPIGSSEATLNIGIRRVGETAIVANDIDLYAERY